MTKEQAKSAKKAKPLVGLFTGQELNAEFYRGYDPFAIFRRVEVFWTVINYPEAYSQLLEKIGQSELDEEHIRIIRAEIYFALFQQFEATFMLLVAPFQPSPHWVYLTKYESRDFKNARELFKNSNFSKLSSMTTSNISEFYHAAVYGNMIHFEGKTKLDWNENFKKIDELLKHCLFLYEEGLSAYNSYKHGIRIDFTPIEFSFRPTGSEANVLESYEEDAIKHLEINDSAVRTKFTAFSVQEALSFVNFLAELSNQIRSIRLGILDGKMPETLTQWMDVDLSVAFATGPKLRHFSIGPTLPDGSVD